MGNCLIPVNFFFWGAGAKEGAPGSRIPAGRYFEPMPAPAHSDLVVTHVPWLATPSYPEVLAAYPAKARAQGVGGHVVLNCRFDRHARLSQCDTLLEQPPKYGFGQAAKALAQAFVAPPTLSDGTSLQETSTQIEMTFAAEMLGDRAPIMRARQWTVLPDRANLFGSFVAAARAAHVVQAGLQCLVDPGGTLSDCTALSKEPAGAEFTTAALALAPLIRVPVWTDEGLPVVGGRIAVPLRYEAAGLASPPELMEQRPQPPLISPTIPPSTMAR